MTTKAQASPYKSSHVLASRRRFPLGQPARRFEEFAVGPRRVPPRTMTGALVAKGGELFEIRRRDEAHGAFGGRVPDQ